uniref:Nuclear receptor-binding factor 2 MIT domain-containing protein n=1 Tax=Phocoena sinus TaxID=42100 RepID=A0A8C9BUM9_PHOSS
MEIMEGTLNLAHQSRRADRLVAAGKYEEAISCHKKAAASHMPRGGWARESWPLSLRVRSLCSAEGEATTVRGPRTAKINK